MKNTLKIALAAVGYLFVFILCATSGIIHPMCYAYVGAVVPLLSAFLYLYVAANLQSFGAATILNGFITVLFLIAGEADTTLLVGMAVVTAAAEIVRFCCRYKSIKGVRLSFIPFGLSFFAYTLHWWTDSEGSLAAAVEEMRPGYDELMKPVIDNTLMLIIVIVLAIPISIGAMRLAEKVMKNQAAKLK